MKRDLISIEDLSRAEMEYLFGLASEMRDYIAQEERVEERVIDRTMASLFFEPSSRTRDSFKIGWHNLGGEIIIGFDAAESSSVAKGESLADTARIYDMLVQQGGGGLIVVRHPEAGASEIVAEYADVPVINAGDGINEHPTQALLDLWTILQEKKRLDNLTIGIMGDLKNSRTVHSLMLALNQFEDIEFFINAPHGLWLNEEFLGRIKHKVRLGLAGVFPLLDVLYVTRVQKERFENQEEYEAVKGSYQVNPELMIQCNKEMILMHPLPRVDEITPEVDKDPRAVYFQQSANGVPIRMALMAAILTETL